MLKLKNAFEGYQCYQFRDFKRMRTYLIIILVITVVGLPFAYQQDALHAGWFVPLFILPAAFASKSNPLCFNAQGVFWKGAVCEQKRFRVIAGFVYWQDVESLTWQAHEKGGSSAVIRFSHSTLHPHIPTKESVKTSPQEQDSEIIEVTLALYRLDSDSETVFREMQQHWQNATPRIERNPAYA